MLTESLIYQMALDDLAGFVDQEGGGIGLAGGATEPSAGVGAAGAFGGLEGAFGIGMKNLSAGVFGLLYGPARKVARAVVA